MMQNGNPHEQLDTPAQEGPELPRERQPYVKPMIQQLHYMVDQHVSLAASCKTTGAATGPTTANCKDSGNVPCAALGS